MKTIILLGVTNSGKGTLSNYLISKYKFSHMSIGHILRRDFFNNPNYVAKDAPKKNSFFMSNEQIWDIAGDFLSNSDLSNGVILDGFPRTIEQAKSIDSLIAKHRLSEPIILNLKISEKECYSRSANRYTCRNCGAPYNKKFNPTKVEGVCDNCGSTDMYQRPEDSESEIHRKLERYKETEEKAIEKLKSQGKIIHDIDGEKSIKEIQKIVADILK